MHDARLDRHEAAIEKLIELQRRSDEHIDRVMRIVEALAESQQALAASQQALAASQRALTESQAGWRRAAQPRHRRT